jgi:hypothetical protein
MPIQVLYVPAFGFVNKESSHLSLYQDRPLKLNFAYKIEIHFNKHSNKTQWRLITLNSQYN